MAAVKIKADGTIVLPKEAMRKLDRKKRYEATSVGDGIVIVPASKVSLKEFLDRTNDGTPAPSEKQIEEWIDDSRRQK